MMAGDAELDDVLRKLNLLSLPFLRRRRRRGRKEGVSAA
jgi:hypothetical protein